MGITEISARASCGTVGLAAVKVLRNHRGVQACAALGLLAIAGIGILIAHHSKNSCHFKESVVERISIHNASGVDEAVWKLKRHLRMAFVQDGSTTWLVTKRFSITEYDGSRLKVVTKSGEAVVIDCYGNGIFQAVGTHGQTGLSYKRASSTNVYEEIKKESIQPITRLGKLGNGADPENIALAKIIFDKALEKLNKASSQKDTWNAYGFQEGDGSPEACPWNDISRCARSNQSNAVDLAKFFEYFFSMHTKEFLEAWRRHREQVLLAALVCDYYTSFRRAFLADCRMRSGSAPETRVDYHRMASAFVLRELQSLNPVVDQNYDQLADAAEFMLYYRN